MRAGRFVDEWRGNGVFVALGRVTFALSVAARPADAEHTYGHTKAEYLSSAFEGGLILLAAASIGVTAVGRLLSPRPIEAPGLGLAITGAAGLINLAVARVLLSAGRRHESITLEADGHHLMTDVWTSAGVIIGVAVAVLGIWLLVRWLT